jgi:hypothetical protein
MVSWPHRRRSDEQSPREIGSQPSLRLSGSSPSLWQRGASKFRTDVQPLHARITTHPGQALYEMVVMARPFSVRPSGEWLRCDLVAFSQVGKIETALTPAHMMTALQLLLPTRLAPGLPPRLLGGRAPFICSARSPARPAAARSGPLIQAHCRPISAAGDPHVDELHRCRCWDDIERHLVGDRLRHSKAGRK